jgi:ABC-type transport system substrate-binding protein
MKRRTVLATGTASVGWPGWAAAQASESRAGEKVLRLAFPAPETGFDSPQINSDFYSATLIAQIFEAPLAYDYLARPVQLVPNTAASLPDISADGRRFTFRIRPSIFFQDDPAFNGKPRELVAADYVFSLKRYYDPQYNSSDLYLLEQAKLVGLSELRNKAIKNKTAFEYDTEVPGLRTVDRYTFEVQLAEPNPRFVYQFADQAHAGAVAREVVERYGKDISAHPVGTGAFKLDRWRRASRIEFVRSPTFRRVVYSGTPGPEPLAQAIAKDLQGQILPRVDRVVIDIVEESQPRWLGFLQGQYNWLAVPASFAPQAVPGGKLAPYLAKRGIRLQTALQAHMVMSFFFMEDPLVGGYTPDKVALRRAIALGLDGEAYRRHVLGGMAIPAQSVIAPFTSGFNPDYRSEMSEYSPSKAKALLDMFGYTDRNGDGWRETPDGGPLVLRIASLATQIDRVNNELWQRNMRAIGIRVAIEVSTWPELLKRTRAGELMTWGYGWSAGNPDGNFFLGIAYGPNAADSNDPRFKLDAYDRLFEQAQRLPDGPERLAVMRQAKDMLVAYMPYKVLGHSIANDLVQPWTRGYWRHPFMRDIWRFVGVDERAAS